MANQSPTCQGVVIGAHGVLQIIVEKIREKYKFFSLSERDVRLMMANNPIVKEFVSNAYSFPAVSDFADEIAGSWAPSHGICEICSALYEHIEELLIKEPSIVLLYLHGEDHEERRHGPLIRTEGGCVKAVDFDDF